MSKESRRCPLLHLLRGRGSLHNLARHLCEFTREEGFSPTRYSFPLCGNPLDVVRGHLLPSPPIYVRPNYRWIFPSGTHFQDPFSLPVELWGFPQACTLTAQSGYGRSFGPLLLRKPLTGEPLVLSLRLQRELKKPLTALPRETEAREQILALIKKCCNYLVITPQPNESFTIVSHTHSIAVRAILRS